mmetsp:Transcript_54719/g.152694  ORF Transcript_54719/g.152694 Transcript_54719/m.152694 type:complete len:282 (-) Transcript_54719:269-1114(-)
MICSLPIFGLHVFPFSSPALRFFPLGHLPVCILYPLWRYLTPPGTLAASLVKLMLHLPPLRRHTPASASLLLALLVGPLLVARVYLGALLALVALTLNGTLLCIRASAFRLLLHLFHLTAAPAPAPSLLLALLLALLVALMLPLPLKPFRRLLGGHIAVRDTRARHEPGTLLELEPEAIIHGPIVGYVPPGCGRLPFGTVCRREGPNRLTAYARRYPPALLVIAITVVPVKHHDGQVVEGHIPDVHRLPMILDILQRVRTIHRLAQFPVLATFHLHSWRGS